LSRSIQFLGASAAWLVFVVFFTSGCALAPGMHLGMSGSNDGYVDTSARVNGLKVRLRSLTPRLVTEIQHQDEVVKTIPDEFTRVKAEPYRLGLYDVVTVAVWEHPELTMPLGQYRSDLASGQMIDQTGGLFYPYVGMLQAKGLTTTELRTKLLASLSRILNNPQLDVKITGFRSQKVFVHGGVLKPGTVPVTDVPLTLLDAVNQAGGLSPFGDGSQVEFQRGGSKVVVDLFADYGAGVDPSRVVMRDGDVVRVPTRDESKVYLLGEVERAQALPLNNGHMSLAQAIAEGGGITPLSAQGKGLYVIRMHDSSSVDLFHLNARNPLALAIGDRFPLKPHDIVWVDATGLARWNRVIGLLAPTAVLYNSAAQGAVYTKELVP
jgi:polysaccharide biosynthesis/export protein